METKRAAALLVIVALATCFDAADSNAQIVAGTPAQVIAAPPDPVPLPNSTAYFAFALAVDGNTAIFAPASGRAAYVYTRSGPHQPWSYDTELALPTGAQWFNAVRLDGDTAVLSVGLVAGALYVFERSHGVWSLSQTLMEPDPAPLSDPIYFGFRMDFKNGVIAAGNLTDDESRGAIYVWERDDTGTFVYRQKLLPFDGAAHGLFGFSVAIDGRSMIVGAPQAAVAYSFRRGHDGWVADELLPPPSGTNAGNFGYNVALDGRTAVISSPSADLQEQPFFHIGAAFVYRRTGSHWSFEQRLDDPLENDGLFGDVVGVQGDKLVVNAWGRLISSDTRADRLVIFERHNGTWTPVAMLTGQNEGFSFGYVLAWSGKDLFTSANSTPTPNPVFEGEVYHYVIPRR